jgi:hypothetical protein
LFIPKVSWTQGANAAVSYGALVGTPSSILLLPRSGTETAGFTLKLQWIPGAASSDDIWRFMCDPNQPIQQLESTLVQSMPQWQTRCVYPLAHLTRFEILSGWKLWLGVSVVMQVASEGPAAVRVPDKSHLEEMRTLYGAFQR